VIGSAIGEKLTESQASWQGIEGGGGRLGLGAYGGTEISTSPGLKPEDGGGTGSHPGLPI